MISCFGELGVGCSVCWERGARISVGLGDCGVLFCGMVARWRARTMRSNDQNMYVFSDDVCW